MKFDVPAYSQFLDLEDEEWKDRSCVIVSLKMLLDYWNNDSEVTSEDLENLITEALASDAYIPGIGWKHKELVDVAKAHKMDGENLDWTSEHPDIAFNKMLPYLEKHPVIASVFKDLKAGESGHLVVVTGYEDGNIYYNDADSKDREGIKRSVPLKEFLDGWTRRIVVIHQKECDCNI